MKTSLTVTFITTPQCLPDHLYNLGFTDAQIRASLSAQFQSLVKQGAIEGVWERDLDVGNASIEIQNIQPENRREIRSLINGFPYFLAR